MKNIDPLQLSTNIKPLVGEVKDAQVIGDGNGLIGCSIERWVEKSQKAAKCNEGGKSGGKEK